MSTNPLLLAINLYNEETKKMPSKHENSLFIENKKRL
jgi:hypothetical protein